MAKTIIVSVSCRDSFAEVPNAFSIEVCDSLAERIRSLSVCVKQADAEEIADQCTAGVWGNADDLDDDELSDNDPEAISVKIESGNVRLQLQSLRVSGDRFSFSAITETGGVGDERELYTRPIPIVELAKPEAYISLD